MIARCPTSVWVGKRGAFSCARSQSCRPSGKPPKPTRHDSRLRYLDRVRESGPKPLLTSGALQVCTVGCITHLGGHHGGDNPFQASKRCGGKIFFFFFFFFWCFFLTGTVVCTGDSSEILPAYNGGGAFTGEIFAIPLGQIILRLNWDCKRHQFVNFTFRIPYLLFASPFASPR